ncbi:MAG: tyrosine-protein phosphatase [Gemmatimonadales bacterium]
MIDLHSHLLPGVDDGARSVEQSVKVLHVMAAQGVTDVVLTPHLEASRLLEGPPPEHDEAFAALSQAAPPGIRLHRGAEVMLDRAITPRAAATRRVTLGGSRYLLVEFTRMVAARSAAAALHQVVQSGLVPLLAHPERYQATTPAVVIQWRNLGALMQVDATTLLAASGRGERARALLAAGLIDVMAADNHGDHRSLAEAATRLTEAGGGDVVEMLTDLNPKAILADDELRPAGSFTFKVPLLKRLKGWFGEGSR